MLIEVVRLMTEAELRLAYNTIPQPILDKLIPQLPVNDRDENGNALYLEPLVDRAIRLYYVKKLAPATAANLRLDGLVLPDKLRVDGREYGPFTPGEMRLLGALWGKGGVAVRRVLNSVYGTDEPAKERQFPDQSLDKLVKRLRVKLLEYGAPVEVRKKDSYYMLDAFKAP